MANIITEYSVQTVEEDKLLAAMFMAALLASPHFPADSVEQCAEIAWQSLKALNAAVPAKDSNG